MQSKWVTVHEEERFSVADSLCHRRVSRCLPSKLLQWCLHTAFLFVWLSFPMKLISVLLFKSKVGCCFFYFKVCELKLDIILYA